MLKIANESNRNPIELYEIYFFPLHHINNYLLRRISIEPLPMIYFAFSANKNGSHEMFYVYFHRKFKIMIRENVIGIVWHWTVLRADKHCEKNGTKYKKSKSSTQFRINSQLIIENVFCIVGNNWRLFIRDGTKFRGSVPLSLMLCVNIP